MTRTPFQTNWRAAKRRIELLWRPNRPRDVLEAESSLFVTAEKLAVQEAFAPASLLERAADLVSLPTLPGQKKEETKQQGEAINTWEDEGGAAALRKPEKSKVVALKPKV